MPISAESKPKGLAEVALKGAVDFLADLSNRLVPPLSPESKQRTKILRTPPKGKKAS